VIVGDAYAEPTQLKMLEEANNSTDDDIKKYED
jgi:hypothetical protein